MQVLVPALFFALMCIPKYYVPKPVPIPEQLYPSADLDSGFWGQPYFGEFHTSFQQSTDVGSGWRSLECHTLKTLAACGMLERA